VTSTRAYVVPSHQFHICRTAKDWISNSCLQNVQ